MGGVCLMFPPANDPRAPHLALPSLTAFLRDAGIPTTQRDLDTDALWWILEPDRLAAAEHRLAQRRQSSAHESVSRLLDWAPRLQTAAPAALATLRDPVAFYDPDLHHQARAVINMALRLVSAANGHVTYGTENATYHVDGADPSRLDDLVRITGDPRYDLFADYYEQDVLPELDHQAPDVVGVSVVNRQQIVPGLRLARLVKQRGWFTVIGGTVFAKFVAELRTRVRFFETFCHGLVPYEGETALADLATLLNGGRGHGSTRNHLSQLGLDNVPNLMWLDQHNTVRANRVHVEDVATLPTPDFAGLPLDRYLAPAPVLPILTGKGCYFNRCKFCDIPAINRVSRKPYRIRPVERVADDLHTLNARIGARHFVITDEALAPRFLCDLASALDDRDHGYRFVGYARLEPRFTRPVFERLHHIGFRKLFFGLESGSQAVLDHMTKGIRLEPARRTLRDCAAAGIAAHVFSIIGFPEETERQARETAQFLLDERETLAHPAHTFDVHAFGLDLRTEYYEQAADYGLSIDPAEQSRDFPISVVSWRDSRGLDRADVDRLIAEFSGELRERYLGARCYPAQQWPGYEEYAVLFGDRYESRPFEWLMALPDEGDPREYRLMWASELRFDVGESHVTVHTPATTEVVTRAALVALAEACGPAPVSGLLAEIASRVPHRDHEENLVRKDVRSIVDRLLAARVMWLRPEAGIAA